MLVGLGTVTLQVALYPFGTLAVIVQVPVETALTCPLELTVATSSSLDVHVILSLLSAGVNVAVSVCFPPPTAKVSDVLSNVIPVAVASEVSP